VPTRPARKSSARWYSDVSIDTLARKTETSANSTANVLSRVEAPDWRRITDDLNTRGATLVGPLLTAEECDELIQCYARSKLFRSRVVMQRHGFGQGEYQYFAYPLPKIIAELRTALYAPLVIVANEWRAAFGVDQRFPPRHEDYIARCHDAGQTRPTPLLLRYSESDYNCLHQDIYGEEIFPLQVAILLSEPGKDFSGGEFVLTEQRPRRQSRAEVVPLRRGDAVIFAVRERPVRGARGYYRVNMRHGVSRLRSGERFTCGIIFHDAA
jgi:hypothetical protein